MTQGFRRLVSELDIKSASGSGFNEAAVFEDSECVQNGFHAQAVIPAQGSNGWQAIPGTEYIREDLGLEGIG